MNDPKKILIIEDDNALRKAVLERFSLEGFEGYEAVNGTDGLNLALQQKPDVILLDILLPDGSGLDVLKKLRADEWGKTTAVLLLTKLSDMEKITEATQIGVEGYLVKGDWKIDEVVKKVKSLIGME